MSKSKMVTLVMLVLLLMPCTQIFAQQTADLKIAVVDYDKVFYKYSLTKTQFLQLKKEQDKLGQYIKDEQKKIAEDKKIYNEQEQFYNEGKKREELLKIWTKMLDLEMKVKEKTKELEEAEESIVTQINKLINTAIEKARKKLDYDIVISKNSVFAINDTIKDITQYVIDILEKN